MAPITKDLHLTTEFLVLLRAGFYGQIIFEGTLASLNSTFAPNNYLNVAHRAFDKIDAWMKDLVSELPIFSTTWETPETFDAISAMNFMRDLRKDFLFIIPHVEAALQVENLSQDREAVKLLVASLVRSAATRNAYIETLSTVYSVLKANDLAQQVSYEVEPTREYLRVTRIIQERFSTTAAYDSQLCEQLRVEALLTPGDFRALAHDTNVMLNVFAKEFTFQLADFAPGEADEWIAQRIPAVAAGYWRAYGFSPQEFIDWKAQGITGAPLAANWTRAGFSAAEAIEWIREGIPPMLAVPWRAEGFDAKRSATLISRGVTDPTRAPHGDSAENNDQQDGEDDDGYR
ncbi:MAG: hypothetical protein ACK5GN_05050 [Pseudomonadota bacterium]|jgi:hypothetical protein